MNHPELTLRSMQPDEWPEVAELIHDSTNAWYENRGLPPIFRGGPASTLLFCEVYEALDPGCCLVAHDAAADRIVGSCFFHPRPSHLSIGIMNVHPDYFGRRIAVQLLSEIVARARQQQLPVRLVSSAMNLDSFSLYNRFGFRPTAVYQDMLFTLPPGGIEFSPPNEVRQVRSAVADDAAAMAELEFRLTGIDRAQDYRFFIDNRQGIWSVQVAEDEAGQVAGFMAAVRHPASSMIGPGVATSSPIALALIYRMLEFHRGNTCVLLAPSNRPELLAELYRWRARNCEIHLGQVLGESAPVEGLVFPTFMPETG